MKRYDEPIRSGGIGLEDGPEEKKLFRAQKGNNATTLRQAAERAVGSGASERG